MYIWVTNRLWKYWFLLEFIRWLCKTKNIFFFRELYTVLTLKLFFHKDLQITNFALMQTKHQQNELAQTTVLCQWACGRGSNKRGLTQTNSLKSSKSSLHEIARDSGRAIGGSLVLSGQIMRKSEEGLIICPWGHQTLYYSTIVLEFSTTESSQPIRRANRECSTTCQPITIKPIKLSPCTLFWQGEPCF